MTDVAFYHLEKSPLEAALPRLLEKTLKAGKRAVVMAGSEVRVESLCVLLWTYGRDTWLPHGSAKDGNAADQPVWLTEQDENPNNAEYLFLTDGAASERVADYERCFEIFDGNDEAAVEAARARWKGYAGVGFGLAFWQQTESGSWFNKE